MIPSISLNLFSVDLMPGENDPATGLLPQQPLHKCMFPQVIPKASHFFSCVFLLLLAILLQACTGYQYFFCRISGRPDNPTGYRISGRILSYFFVYRKLFLSRIHLDTSLKTKIVFFVNNLKQLHNAQTRFPVEESFWLFFLNIYLPDIRLFL